MAQALIEELPLSITMSDITKEEVENDLKSLLEKANYREPKTCMKQILTAMMIDNSLRVKFVTFESSSRKSEEKRSAIVILGNIHSSFV